MNILYIEPYYDGSHKQWINSFKEYSNHSIEIISLPASKWKWRMHGGAITLANKFNSIGKRYDLILCSDFLNLPVFISLCKKKLKDIPIAMYYHENQISYPWSPSDQDIKLNRDFHYYYINQTSSMVSDWNFFNSYYHLGSYLDGLRLYLNKMPDNKNSESIDQIMKKSSVLYIGCDLDKLSKNKDIEKSKKPVILWNHRWEFDKNPELFFNTLIRLKENNVAFSLVVLGKKYLNSPDIFIKAKKLLSDEIIHFGYCDSHDEYKKWLWRSDILPVTSNQDFFGISTVEAVYCKTYPILPERLSYVELFNKKRNPENFYRTNTQLYNKLLSSIKNYRNLPSLSNQVEKYNWQSIIENYDNEMNKISKI